MPVYNARKYLRAAINSILTQSFTDFEFVIINDGSTDSSEKIIKSYSDPRICYIEHQTNLGIVESLNDGLSAAKGKYIARMDADDISLPNRLLHQVNFLEQHPDHVGVGASILYIDPEGWPIAGYQPDTSHEIIDDYLLSGHANVIVHSAFTGLREAVLSIGCYQPAYQYAEDLDLFLKLAEIGKLSNVQELLHKVRLHENSICVLQTDQWRDLKTRILSDTRSRRGVNVNLDEFAIGRRRSEDFRYKWAYQAFGHKFIHTASKNLLISVVKTGPQRKHLDFVKELGGAVVSFFRKKIGLKPPD